MQSLWEKIRTGSLALAHSLADRANEAQGVEYVKQLIRDIESAKVSVESDANEADGAVRNLRRKIRDAEERAKTLDQQIHEILTDRISENNKDALPYQVELDGINDELLPGFKAELEEALSVSGELESVVTILEARHREMMVKLDKLERTEKRASGKNTAAEALRKSREILESGAGRSVDSMIGKMSKDADTAAAAFDRERKKIGDVAGQDKAIGLAQSRLAQRLANLEAPPAS